MDVDALLALHTPAQGSMVRKSAIVYSDPGFGLFASRQIGKGEVVRYIYDSLVDSSLTKQWKKTKNYGEGMMPMTAKTL